MPSEVTKAMIVCIRKADVPPAKVVPGSTACGTCSKCGEQVYMAPSSQKMMLAGHAGAICAQCSRDVVFDAVALAPGALQEFAEYRREESRRTVERN